MWKAFNTFLLIIFFGYSPIAKAMDSGLTDGIDGLSFPNQRSAYLYRTERLYIETYNTYSKTWNSYGYSDSSVNIYTYGDSVYGYGNTNSYDSTKLKITEEQYFRIVDGNGVVLAKIESSSISVQTIWPVVEYISNSGTKATYLSKQWKKKEKTLRYDDKEYKKCKAKNIALNVGWWTALGFLGFETIRLLKYIRTDDIGDELFQYKTHDDAALFFVGATMVSVWPALMVLNGDSIDDFEWTCMEGEKTTYDYFSKSEIIKIVNEYNYDLSRKYGATYK